MSTNSGNMAAMRKHLADFEDDVARQMRSGKKEKELAKAIERAKHVWDLSAQVEFKMTLEQMREMLK